MKLFNFFAIIIFIGFCFSCAWQEKEQTKQVVGNNVAIQDSALQAIINKLSSDEVFTLSKKKYEYFFERFIEDSIQQNNGRVKFGTQYFFVTQENNEYVLEKTEPDTSFDEQFYFKLIRKFAEDPIYGETEILEIRKVPDLHENE